MRGVPLTRRTRARRLAALGAAGKFAAQALASQALKAGASVLYNKAVGYMSKPKNKKRRANKVAKQNKVATKKTVQKVQRQVKKLQKSVKSSEGTLIYFGRGLTEVIASVNQQTLSSVANVPISSYETVLGELRFFDSATPGTLVQASGATGTYSRKYMFNVYTHTVVRNNYQIPADVRLYLCCPREDTSIPANQAYTDGLVDVGNPSNTSQLMKLTHSPLFNQLWKIEKMNRVRLMPGQETELIHTYKVMYDPAITDSQTQTYQTKYKNFMVLCRVDGILAHDTVSDQQGFAQAGVDVATTYKYTVKYDAGVDLTYYVISDGAQTFNNGAVVSAWPIADNQGYSLA